MAVGMSGGKAGSGASTGSGTLYPKVGFAVLGNSSPKSSTGQKGALKLPGTWRGGRGK